MSTAERDSPPHPYLAASYPRAMAHRGWHLDELAGMENSMASFRRAIAEGYRYLEIDVHATPGGAVVVCHDASLDRTTDRTVPIAAQPRDVVRTARVRGREAVPGLREVLDELPAQIPARRGPVTVVDRAVLAAAHEVGLEVHVWTMNKAERMPALLDLGVDLLISDRPDVLREVLAERGQWPGP